MPLSITVNYSGGWLTEVTNKRSSRNELKRRGRQRALRKRKEKTGFQGTSLSLGWYPDCESRTEAFAVARNPPRYKVVARGPFICKRNYRIRLGLGGAAGLKKERNRELASASSSGDGYATSSCRGTANRGGWLPRKAVEGRTGGGEGEGGFYYGANGSKEIKEHSLCEKLLRRNIFSVKRGATREGEKETDRPREREREREREGGGGNRESVHKS